MSAGPTQPTTNTNGEPPEVTTGECMGEPATSTLGTNDTSTPDLCPEHPQVDACCCFDIFADHGEPVCGNQLLCQEIVLKRHHVPFDGEMLITSCPAAIDCALAALIAGTPGSIRWRIESDSDIDQTDLYIVGDGTAFSSGYYEVTQDSGGIGAITATRGTLGTKAYFTKCAGYASGMSRFTCLQEALIDTLEVCDGG